MDNFINLKILSFIKENGLLSKNDNVLVAVSGGADSIALLHFLHTRKEVFEINVDALHINHNLRGVESDRDQRFVEEFCASYGIPLITKSIDVTGNAKAKKQGIEEVARNIRRQIYTQMLEGSPDDCRIIEGISLPFPSIGYQKIVTGHTANDNAETVLFNILRGTGLKGAGGIKPVAAFGSKSVIRPLLCATRIDVENYIRNCSLTHITDSTNTSSNYTRNFLRNDVLPKLNTRFKTVEALNNFSMLMSEYSGFLDSQTASYLHLVEKGEDRVVLRLCNNLHPVILKQLAEKAIESLDSSIDRHKQLTAKHLDKLSALQNKRTNASVDLPNNIIASKAREAIVFTKEATSRSISKRRNNPQTITSEIPSN